MSQNLIEQVTSGQDARRQSAAERYRQLLRNNTGGPAQAQELSEAMQILGKRPEDLRADRAILLQAQGLAEAVESGKGLEPKERAADQAASAFRAEMEAQIRQMEQRLRKLQDEASVIAQRRISARKSANLLQRLRADHPELLADLPAYDPDNIG